MVQKLKLSILSLYKKKGVLSALASATAGKKNRQSDHKYLLQTRSQATTIYSHLHTTVVNMLTHFHCKNDYLQQMHQSFHFIFF